jgi:hypothetical protein
LDQWPRTLGSLAAREHEGCQYQRQTKPLPPNWYNALQLMYFHVRLLFAFVNSADRVPPIGMARKRQVEAQGVNAVRLSVT